MGRPKGKLGESTASIIAELKRGESSQQSIADKFGVTRAEVSRIYCSYVRESPRKHYGKKPTDPRIIQLLLHRQVVFAESENKRTKHVFWTGSNHKHRRLLKEIVADIDTELRSLGYAMQDGHVERVNE